MPKLTITTPDGKRIQVDAKLTISDEPDDLITNTLIEDMSGNASCEIQYVNHQLLKKFVRRARVEDKVRWD